MDSCVSMAHNLHVPLSAVAKGLFGGGLDPRLAMASMATLESLGYLPNLVDNRLHHAGVHQHHHQSERSQVKKKKKKKEEYQFQRENLKMFNTKLS